MELEFVGERANREAVVPEGTAIWAEVRVGNGGDALSELRDRGDPLNSRSSWPQDEAEELGSETDRHVPEVGNNEADATAEIDDGSVEEVEELVLASVYVESRGEGEDSEGGAEDDKLFVDVPHDYRGVVGEAEGGADGAWVWVEFVL